MRGYVIMSPPLSCPDLPNLSLPMLWSRAPRGGMVCASAHVFLLVTMQYHMLSYITCSYPYMQCNPSRILIVWRIGHTLPDMIS